jgi:tripartite-type tricarboxylate transporter receptor subunit TctC
MYPRVRPGVRVIAFKRIGAVVAALAIFVCVPALSQEAYPARPVRIIVGFGPGSSVDVTARLLGRKLSEILGQQIVIESRPGGGSNIATEYVVRAPNDGYTLLLGTVANAINATFSQNLTFDFARDLTPIGLATTLPNILVVHPSLGVNNVRELIAVAKAKRQAIFFGSAGYGTSPHLSGELFNEMAGVKLVHIPYPGSAQAVTDLLAGRTQVMFSPASTVMPHVLAGKLKALASTELKRASIAPDLPTMSEAGLDGFDTSVWFVLMAPRGTPPTVITKLNGALNQALGSDDVVAALHRQGMDVLGGSPEEAERYIASETKKWAGVIEAAGLKNNP